jgi:hypothetical protein
MVDLTESVLCESCNEFAAMSGDPCRVVHLIKGYV